MVELKVFTKDGKETGVIAGDEKIFQAGYKEALVHQALRWFRAGLRQGTHSTKKRGEVRGGGKKPWKQKGTGRARAGSIRSPLWRGGGVIFGPQPRKYSFAFPNKMSQAALRTVISNRLKEDRIKVVEGLFLDSPKTKEMVGLLKVLDVYGRKTLLLTAGDDRNLVLAGRNIQKLKVLPAKELNIFELLNCEWLVLQKEALPLLSKALLK